MIITKENTSGGFIKENYYSILYTLYLFLLIALAAVYWPLMVNLVKKLWHNEDYSFGLLLPLVSGYIVYLKWPLISRLKLSPSWAGLVVLSGGMLLYLVGILSTDLYTPTLAFFLSLGGVVVLAGGRDLGRLLFFPLLLLVFMVPLPQFLTQKLTLPLQLLSSRLATGLLHFVGVPAVRQGNVIDLGVRQLQVVAACSGLRYLLALLALSLIFCYFYQRRIWKAAVLMLGMIPAAIFANAFRVAAMGIYPGLQEGFWHGFSGWLIFVFCFLWLMGLNRLLTSKADPVLGHPAAPAAGESPSPTRMKVGPLLAGLALIAGAGFLGSRLGDIPLVPLTHPLSRFPLELGDWRGHASAIDPAIFQATGATTYLNADYVNGKGDTINLWIAYYENQRGGGSVHSPFSCLTGSGWSLLKEETRELAPGKPVKVMLMEQGGQKFLVSYWYLQRGRWLTSEYWNKFYMAWDGLTRRRTDGALIRLITPALPTQSSGELRLMTFAKFLIPVLPHFILD